MASLVLSGDTSGTVTLAAPTVAGTQSYTLPTAQPTASGQALVATTAGVMSWASVAASPGGSPTQIQYNNAGAFGGVSGFTTDGTRVTASTTIGVGGATPSTSGSGITFPATQSASTDVNTLDDYEEGTWTPILTAATAPTGVTYNVNAGWYRKIGSLVIVGWAINPSSVGTGGSGEVKITGLPFTSAAYAGFTEPTSTIQGTRYVSSTSAAKVYGFVNASSTTIGTRLQNNADTAFPYSEMQGGINSLATNINSEVYYYV